MIILFPVIGPGPRRMSSSRRHPGTVVLFWAGCGADQNPVPRRSVEFVTQYGQQLADGVDTALQSPMQTIDSQLEVKYEEIDLRFAALPTRGALETDAAGKPPRTFWAKHLLDTWDREGALPSTYPYPVQVWQLGAGVGVGVSGWRGGGRLRTAVESGAASADDLDCGLRKRCDGLHSVAARAG